MESIKVALDWSPNTIHAGLFLAHHKKYYQDSGLEVSFISPEIDEYALTPARRLSRQQVDFAIAPSESAISYNTSRRPVPLTSVASILQRDTSAIVTLKSSAVTRPAQLDGRVYASYNARFEDGIVRKMVQYDGGRGDFKSVAIGRLSIWDMLKKGEADATWVFMPWEGVQAQMSGIELNVFALEDYGIPYGYTPLLLAHTSRIHRRKEAYRRFMKITAAAYKEAGAAPQETAAFLCKHIEHEDFSEPAFIEASLRALQPALLTQDGEWGKMNAKVWGSFINWLVDQKILRPQRPVEGKYMFTNELLE
ncbi:MAG: ABC transporter substrate-binding protein [Cyclonatronaceae bacterium]